MISDAALIDLRARNPVSDLAGKWVRLRRKGRGFVGPCPICSTSADSRTAARFECDDEGWRCAVCHSGGDVIRLVMLREGRAFLDAVKWLGGAQEVDPESAARREAEAAAKRARREKDAVRYRENERRRLFRLWGEGKPVAGSIVEAYLARRGVAAPAGACLRAHDHAPYFEDLAGGKRREIWRGPAMLAAILGPDGRFAGLHQTWIDLDQPKGKLGLAHPETGEILPAKKVRGTMKAGRIELARLDAPARLVIGEGIETVLTAWMALGATGRDISATAFWSGVALGNLGGAAEESVPHPTLKTETGRARRVPGPVPDMAEPSIPIPASVREVVVLGDGDSDPFATRQTLERACARFAHGAVGRRVRIAWPPAGHDFNDLLVA